MKNPHSGWIPVIAEITRSHVFTKEIYHASTRSQYFNGNFYCKDYLRVFSAMIGKPASFRITTVLEQNQIRKISWVMKMKERGLSWNHRYPAY